MRNLDTRNGVKDAWAKVRQVVCGCNSSSDSIAGEVTALKLNDHYADISTDTEYRVPPMKATVVEAEDSVTEIEVFLMLDRLKATATGLDGIPAWFLRQHQ